MDSPNNANQPGLHHEPCYRGNPKQGSNPNPGMQLSDVYKLLGPPSLKLATICAFRITRVFPEIGHACLLFLVNSMGRARAKAIL